MSFSFTRSVSFASFFSSQFTHVSSSSRSSLERRRSHRSSSSSNRARISITNASNPTDEEKKRKKIVVVGAGWGGWGAAKALLESNECEVILLDGLKDPTGKTGQKTASGKPFEIRRERILERLSKHQPSGLAYAGVARRRSVHGIHAIEFFLARTG